MIAQLKGKLAFKSSTEIVVDCGGVGFSCMVSVNTSESLPAVGNDVLVLTLLIPREDAILLYGFKDENEREAFKLLISVSGIGGKIALGILSSVTVAELQQFVLSGNINSLTKMPGIGRKTAERLVLELKDKIIKLGVVDTSVVGMAQSLVRQEAMAALMTLGYSQLIADKAVKKAMADSDQELSAEQLIKISLKFAMN
jgi:Holliday junction DNA helicase RuvA